MANSDTFHVKATLDWSMSFISDKNVLASTATAENTTFFQRLKKLGMVCFLFFLIKGLLWLLLPLGLYLFSNQ
ncbi:hypothetical protein [Kaarinaea lacus]